MLVKRFLTEKIIISIDHLDMKVVLNNINQYIKVLNKKDGSKYIRVVIGEKKTTFVGKYETLEILRDKAIEFIKSVNTATLPNCSGNP